MIVIAAIFIALGLIAIGAAIGAEILSRKPRTSASLILIALILWGAGVGITLLPQSDPEQLSEPRIHQRSAPETQSLRIPQPLFKRLPIRMESRGAPELDGTL